MAANPTRFHHCPLHNDISRKEIRLLHLESSKTTNSRQLLSCSLHHVALEDNPVYEALSYAWGGSSDLHEILVNESPLSVTENLHEALSELLSTGHRTLWVDAICINQADIAEKDVQLKLMRLIYTQAVRTLVWLGSNADDSDLAIDTLLSASVLKETVRPSGEPFETALYSLQTLNGKLPHEKEKTVKSLVSLYNRPYWRRTWIIQEICLARDVVVLCGSKTIPWGSLANGTYRLPGQGRDYQVSDLNFNGTYSGKSESLENSKQDIDWIAGNLQHRMETEPDFGEIGAPKLISAVMACNYTRASDPHDKLYGLLGLVKDADNILPNPSYGKTVAELYVEFTIATIRTTGHLNIICLGQKGTERIQGLPSWALDVSGPFSLSMTFRDWTSKTYQACGDHTFSLDALTKYPAGCRALHTKGIILDEIDGLGGSIATKGGVDCDMIQTSCAANAYGEPAKVIIAMLKSFSMSWGTLGRGPEWFTSAAPPVIFKAAERGEMDPFFEPELSGWCNSTRLLRFNGIPIHQWMEEWPSYLPYRPEDVGRQYPRLPLNSNPRRGLQNFNGSSRGLAIEMHSATSHKRLLVTKEGQIGMAPLHARKGDTIAILFGCKVPVVLRRRDEGHGYIVIGETYVYGSMGGEAVAQLKDNTVCDFHLY